MRWYLFGALLLLGCSRSSAPSFSSSPEAMRDWARAEIARELSDWTLENDADPLLLKLRRDEQQLEVWLGRPFEYCTNNASDCERMAREYVAGVVQAAVESGAVNAPDPGQLVPAIRSKADVESYRARAEGMIEEPIAGDLFVVYMLDSPRSASIVDGKAVTALNLSAEEIKARAFQNLSQQLPALDTLVRPQGEQVVGEIQLDSFYTSSLLVPHSTWRAIAESFGGKLLVAIPAPDVLLYARERDASVLPALAAKAREVFTKSPRGTSLSILRWTPSGWTIALQR